MCVKLMAKVWPLDLPTAEKFVLLALADMANVRKGNTAWPSIATLSRCTGLNNRTVQRAIKTLADSGNITRKEVIGKGAIYTVHPRHSVTPDTVSPVTNTTPTPDTVSPKPLEEPLVERATALSTAARAKSDFVLPDTIPAEAWADFLVMRKAKRAPPTDKAKHLLVAKLLKLAADGHPPGDVLNQSTEHNWTGLFPIKEITNGQRNLFMGGNDRKVSVASIVRDLVAEARAVEAESPVESVGDYRGAWAALPGRKLQ